MKVLTVLCAVALLLFLLVVGSVFVYLKVSRAEASRAVAVEQDQKQKRQRAAEGWANQRPAPPQTAGPSAGIGAVVGRKAAGFVISSILPNTPAARDGRLKAGDLVVAVEEEGRDVVQLAGMKLTDVIKLLRGEANTVITLHVQPVAQPAGELVRIRLVRERLALLEAETRGQLLTNAPTARELVPSLASIPTQIDFKVLRVENPPGTRNILLHFERDKNYGLGIEVWQDVTRLQGGPSPAPDQRDWQHKEWVGVNGPRVLRWVLPQEFSPAEAQALAKKMERKWKGSHPLPDGAVPEFGAAVHRDGWKYHLVTRVLREPDAPRATSP